MDRLLGGLGFDLQTRLWVLHRVRDSFAAEFHVDSDFSHQLAARFRAERRSLEGLLDPAAVPDASLAAGLEVLRRRSQQLASVVCELQACAGAGRLSMPLDELAKSLATRILSAAQVSHPLPSGGPCSPTGKEVIPSFLTSWGLTIA